MSKLTNSGKFTNKLMSLVLPPSEPIFLMENVRNAMKPV